MGVSVSGWATDWLLSDCPLDEDGKASSAEVSGIKYRGARNNMESYKVRQCKCKGKGKEKEVKR